MTGLTHSLLKLGLTPDSITQVSALHNKSGRIGVCTAAPALTSTPVREVPTL